MSKLENAIVTALDVLLDDIVVTLSAEVLCVESRVGMIRYRCEVRNIICKELSPAAVAALRVIRVACRTICNS